MCRKWYVGFFKYQFEKSGKGPLSKLTHDIDEEISRLEQEKSTLGKSGL